MAINDISLTAGMRNNLLALQKTASQLQTTQDRLSSGKRVNSALDNPTNFFAAQAATNRASDLNDRKDMMAEAVQTIKAADNGITAITALIQSAKGLASAAQGTSDTAAQATYQAQYSQIRNQIDTLASDSSYRGTNLLTGNTLSIEFSDKTGVAKLAISNSTTATSTGLALGTATWSTGGAAADLATMDSAKSDRSHVVL